MPWYLVRFRVGTALVRKENVTVEFMGLKPQFLFAGAGEPGLVVVETKLEAPDNRQAWERLSASVLPPILDAMSFATGSPLLLKDCESILKDQSGESKRQVIYIGERIDPVRAELGKEEQAEVTQILARAGKLSLPLTWHRYALDRRLALEKFVFTWLAFESLAGDADVPNRCQTCGETLEHCGRPIQHRSSNKQRAFEIFQAAFPETTLQQFNREIWGKARNHVFHGGRYPEPQFLVQINELSVKLHAAVDRAIAEGLALESRDRPHRRYQDEYRIFHFVEWTTSEPAAQFAGDWPRSHLDRMSAERTPGTAFYATEADGIRILNYERDSRNW